MYRGLRTEFCVCALNHNAPKGGLLTSMHPWGKHFGGKQYLGIIVSYAISQKYLGQGLKHYFPLKVVVECFVVAQEGAGLLVPEPY